MSTRRARTAKALGPRTAATVKNPIMIEAGRKAAHTRKWRAALAKAQRSWRWAITMTRVLIRRSAERRAWRVLDFHSDKGFESAGVVDLVVARRDYSASSRGDLLEIVLVQVKGGSARWPSLDDIARLRRVAKHHRARAVVLSSWTKGSNPRLYQLRRGNADSARGAWKLIENVTAYFS